MSDGLCRKCYNATHLLWERALVFENSRLSPESYQWINVVVMLRLVRPEEKNVVLIAIMWSGLHHKYGFNSQFTHKQLKMPKCARLSLLPSWHEKPTNQPLAPWWHWFVGEWAWELNPPKERGILISKWVLLIQITVQVADLFIYRWSL